MTVTADDLKRVMLPDAHPGERFEYSRDTEGRIILQRVEPQPEAKLPRKRLMKGEDGHTYVTGGIPVTPELVKKLLEDFP